MGNDAQEYMDEQFARYMKRVGGMSNVHAAFEEGFFRALVWAWRMEADK